ncbi:replication protein A 70 kDa DNA-binding subunit B-like [Rutidosis leptorrhynchoides]|uniref:replication protein A 70 kDa DNA-binding subunit B-like n=1 Tax=Rutidosis leptorrhynchoides TaxID=125765 RepID=UPI003A998E96
MSRSIKNISVAAIDRRQVNFNLKVKVVRVVQKLGHGFDEGKPTLELIVCDDMGHKIVVNIRNNLKDKFDVLIKEWGTYYVIGRVSFYGPIQDFKNTGELKNNSLEVDATLWGKFAIDFDNHIKYVSDDSSVILIIQFGVTKPHNRKLAVSTDWNYTNVVFDKNHPQIVDFRQRLNEIHSGDNSIGSLAPSLSVIPPRDRNPKAWFKDAKHLGLNQLNPTLKGIFIVVATINTILPDDLWYYIACKKCNKSAKPVTPNYDLTLDIDQLLALERKCYACRDKPDPVIRFKVPIRVENPTGTASFTVFETVVKKFVTKTAYQLMKEMFEDDDYPEDLEALLEKTLLFKIEVTNFNNERGIRNYTVKDATDNPEYLQIFETFKVDHPFQCEDVEGEPSSDLLTYSVNFASNDDASGCRSIDLSDDIGFSPPLKKIKQELLTTPGSVKSSTTKVKWSDRFE